MVQQGHNEPAEEQEQKQVKDENPELAKIAGLERSLAQKDEEIAGLKRTREEKEKELNRLNSSLGEAIAGYKSAVIQANPELIEGLISGDSINAINESLSQAKELVSRVRQGVEKEISRTRVPAGAPERRPADNSSLSPREKIQQAISKK
jgi:hypothetical protein